MNPSNLRRGWASTATLTVLLGLLLAGLIVWKLAVRFSHIPANHPMADSLRSKDITAHVAVALACMAVAGGVAALAYFVSGRSERAATAGSAAVMLLAIGVFATQLIRYYAGAMPTPAAAGMGGSGGATASPLAALADQQKRLQAQSEAHRRAMQEQADRLREQASRTAARPPSNQPGTGSPGVAPPAIHPPPAAPPVDDSATIERVKQALAPVREEAAQRIGEFMAAAQPAVDFLAKGPRALRSELDKRVSDSVALKQKADELGEYLRALDARAEEALKGAGLEMGAQARGRIAFGHEAALFERAGACRAYASFFGAALDEGEALKQNAGKWRTDANGNVTSAEAGLQSRLRFLRDAVTRRARELIDEKVKLTRPMGS